MTQQGKHGLGMQPTRKNPQLQHDGVLIMREPKSRICLSATPSTIFDSSDNHDLRPDICIKRYAADTA